MYYSMISIRCYSLVPSGCHCIIQTSAKSFVFHFKLFGKSHWGKCKWNYSTGYINQTNRIIWPKSHVLQRIETFKFSERFCSKLIKILKANTILEAAFQSTNPSMSFSIMLFKNMWTISNIEQSKNPFRIFWNFLMLQLIWLFTILNYVKKALSSVQILTTWTSSFWIWANFERKLHKRHKR